MVSPLTLSPASSLPLSPLDSLTIASPIDGTLTVTDAAGREYVRQPISREAVTFRVGGALGIQTVRVEGSTVTAESTFVLDARTSIADTSGRFSQVLDACRRTMTCYTEDIHPRSPEAGVVYAHYKGGKFPCYVHWILDHSHTAKGMQYFAAPEATAGLADLFSLVQKPDGMVWSNVFPAKDGDYFHSAYGPYGFSIIEGDADFNRQPCENHNEYNFVETVYLAWKSGRGDAWLNTRLDNSIRALNYSVTDKFRFSDKYKLLKRGYTIDSWDFQVDDKYSVPFPLGTAQQISESTKFGIFHGDNHGHALACTMLAEMLDAAGRNDEAGKFRQRAADTHERLNAIAWNGSFFLHRVEEDPTVVRELGVDEKSQIAMSNCYALNRGVSHRQAVAILQTYQKLRVSAAPESPAEWYAIYPPFGKGFGADSQKYQYMNAGIHGHAAGELARGAFEHGFEAYGADILLRVADLSKHHPKQFIAFAWTGGYDPEPPAPQYIPLSLAAYTNMDTASNGARKDGAVLDWMLSDAGNDIAAFPRGSQTFVDVPFEIASERPVVAIGANVAPKKTIAIGRKAAALHLLHIAAGIGASGNVVQFTYIYDDGSEHTLFLQGGKHIAGFWYPGVKNQHAAVAWKGNNAKTSGVGVIWCELLNPHPDRTIVSIRLDAVRDGAAGPTYALLGLTLADRPRYHRAPLVSHGGPDNWSGGTVMYALIEGLAGVKDVATGMTQVRLSPRWSVAAEPEVKVIARYGTAEGYIAYTQTTHGNTIRLTLTGSGTAAQLRVLLPPTAAKATATLNGKPAATSIERVEQSTYACLHTALDAVKTAEISFG
jgi:hypothetical protein